jgi:hypothetical protein
MKGPFAILATLAALALPALAAGAPRHPAGSPDAPVARERGWVDASELTDLLAEKGLISPQEQQSLRQPMEAPPVDERTQEEIFRTESYRGDS